MDFTQYRRLKRLVLHCSSFDEFLSECGKWSKYGVALWHKENYRWFYEKIKGGHNYVTLFKAA